MFIKSLLDRCFEYICGSKYQEFIWSSRHIREGNKWIYVNLVNTINHPHRAILKDTITKYTMDSVLEIGCGAGINLRLLNNEAQVLFGIDINSKNVEIGNKYNKEQGYKTIILKQGKVDNLSMFKDKSIDLTFTDAVLLYIAPDKIDRVISELVRVTKKICVLCEWNRDNKNESYYKDHWVHNYEYLFTKHGITTMKKTKIRDGIFKDECWGKYGYIIEAIL